MQLHGQFETRMGEHEFQRLGQIGRAVLPGKRLDGFDASDILHGEIIRDVFGFEHEFQFIKEGDDG